MLHASLVALGYWLAFLLRFEFSLSPHEWRLFLLTLPLILVARLGAFGWFQLYEGLWRYVSMRDILAILKAVTLGSFVLFAGVLAVFGRGFPRTVLLLDWLICLALVGGMRLAVRAIRESGRSEPARGRRAIIVGAGDAGEMRPSPPWRDSSRRLSGRRWNMLHPYSRDKYGSKPDDFPVARSTSASSRCRSMPG